MLAAFVESEPDREIRYRALVETILALPPPLRSAVVRTGLLPAVRTDTNVIRLLARLSGDELAELAGSIPAEELRGLQADLDGAPIESWMKARMRESLEDVLATKEVAAAPLELLIGDEDPALAEFRERVHAGCAPDHVLEHSVAVLVTLMEETESELYPVLLTSALEETIQRGPAARAIRARGPGAAVAGPAREAARGVAGRASAPGAPAAPPALRPRLGRPSWPTAPGGAPVPGARGMPPGAGARRPGRVRGHPGGRARRDRAAGAC